MSALVKTSSLARKRATLEQLIKSREKLSARYKVLEASGVIPARDLNEMSDSISELNTLIGERLTTIAAKAKEAIRKEASLLTSADTLAAAL